VFTQLTPTFLLISSYIMVVDNLGFGGEYVGLGGFYG